MQTIGQSKYPIYRWAALLAGMAAFASLPLHAQALPEGAPVRIAASGLGNGGWLDGKITLNKGSGCTMVVFAQKQPGGYTMVALNAVSKLETKRDGGWVDVPVKPLLAKETKACREAAND